MFFNQIHTNKFSMFFNQPAAGAEKIWRFFPPIFRTLGGKKVFSPHFPDPGGKIEKAVSPHNGGKKDTPELSMRGHP